MDSPEIARFIAIFSSGVALGAVTALVALGFLLIYKATGAINFAQGELVTLGAYFAFWTTSMRGLPVPLGYLVTLVMMFGAGVALERVAYRPIRDRSIHVVVISTLGAALAIRAGIGLWMGNRPRHLSSPLGFEVWQVAGARIPYHTILIALVTLVCVAVTVVAFAKTPFGRQVRALATDQTTARLVGIRVSRMSMTAWGLGAVLSGMAGILIAPRVAITLDLGFPPMLNAFFAAILGGFGRLWGVVVGAMAIGLVQQLGAAYVDPSYKEVYPFAMMLLVIALRPEGIFGSEARARL